MNISKFMTDINKENGNRLASVASLHDESIAERLYQSDFLLNDWMSAPFFGKGYGYSASGYVRTNNARYSYELIPVAMLMKLGIVGLLLYLSYWGWILYSLLKKRQEYVLHSAYLVGGLISLFIVSNTNPVFVNFVGITVFALFLLQWSTIKKTKKIIC